MTGKFLRAVICAFPLLAVLTGCDPCFGVASCGQPQIRYQGRLLKAYSQAPATGALVEFVGSARSGLEHGLIVARTDSAGYFDLSGPALSDGQVQGTLRVFFQDTALVDSVPGLRLATTPTGGDQRMLGTMLVGWPHFETFGRLHDRATGKPVVGVEVEFRRVGGIPVEPNRFTVRSDKDGFFPLRPTPLAARGDVVVDLLIRAPAPLRTDTIRGLRLASTLGQDRNAFVHDWGVGVHLPFIGRAVFSGNSAPAAGTVVTFRRTGGIALAQDSFTNIINEWGGFSLSPIPLEPGKVAFTLTFQPPPPFKAVTYPYEMETLETDASPSIIETWVIPR